MIGTLLLALFLALSSAGCGDDANKTPKTGQQHDPIRGKRIYMANCTACHNMDPSKAGSLGPPIKGSAPELLEARVLGSTYPPGYTPKRNTSAMPAFPHLRSAIGDLAAFLR